MAREIICATRDEWIARRREGVTASEIPAVLGISPWLSAFSLHWQKRMAYQDDDSARKARGRRLEALVREDFLDQHPEMKAVPAYDQAAYAVMYCHDERPWQICTPDAIVWHMRIAEDHEAPSHYASNGDSLVSGPATPLELKTSASAHGWGPSGSDIIPTHYRAQLQWQIDILDAAEGWLAVWIGLDDYREYLIKRDEEDLTVMRKAAEQFRQQLHTETPPPVDALTSTTATLKHIYADAEPDDTAIIPDFVADTWDGAREQVRQAKRAMQLMENDIRARMGTATRAVDSAGRTVAKRIIYERQGYQAKPATIDRLYPGKRS